MSKIIIEEPKRKLREILEENPPKYSPELISRIIDETIIENDLILAREDFSKKDKDAGYFDLEMKLSVVIPYFHKEFTNKNKIIEGRFGKEFDDLNQIQSYSYIIFEIGYKLEKYLPKRLTKEFKENYPLISLVIDINKERRKMWNEAEIKRLSPKVTKDFLPYYQNGSSNDLMNNIIGASKRAKSDLTGKKYSHKYKLNNNDEGLITIDLDNLTDFTGKKAPAITDGHKKAFSYASYLLKSCSDPYNVFFNYNDFLKIKGVEPTGKNRILLKQQLKELNCLYWNIRDKKGKWKGNVRLFSIDKSTTKGAFLRFGDWVDEDFAKTFALIDKNAYKYNEPKAAIGGAFTISQKISVDIRLNWNNPKRNKDGVFSITVKNLTPLLGLADNVYAKKGFSYVRDRLENCLDEISQLEGIAWQYRNGDHESKDDFLNDFIEYRHDRLLKIYTKDK